MERYRYNHIRIPSPDIPSHVPADSFCIVLSIFTASKKFVPEKRLFHLCIIQEHSSAAFKTPVYSAALRTVLFCLFYRFAAFHTVMFCKRMQEIFTFRTDVPLPVSQNPIAYRTSGRIQNIQTYFFYLQSCPFSLMTRSLLCSVQECLCILAARCASCNA